MRRTESRSFAFRAVVQPLESRSLKRLTLAIQAAAALTPVEVINDVVLVTDGEIINAIDMEKSINVPTNARRLRFPDAVLVPGFTDVHIHGAAGYDVMRANKSEISAIERLLARHGVTSYLPTTVTAPIDETLRSVERLAQAIERATANEDGGRARPIGIHLEGPFLSHEKRGVHPSEHIVDASLPLFERMWQASRGYIRMMTIAPEIPGALELTGEAARRGVCVSLGHTNADFKTATLAVERGARHATHTFNAMRALDHRDPGVLGAVLNDSRITADIIADGVHVDPAVVSLFLRAKGTEGAVLITDSLSATGMPDGNYRLGTFDIELRGNRCLSAEGRLAGSVLTLDRAVRNVMAFAGWTLQDAVRLVTHNPARMLGMENNIGVLAAGMRADLVVLSRTGEVLKTFVAGREIS
jgi:N-acetylglucosamine-6-phosphate deacetylase